MATQTIPILGRLHYGSNGAAYPQNYVVENSGTTQNAIVPLFEDAATGTISLTFMVPEDYAGSPVLVIGWTSETTAGNVRFEAVHRVMTAGSTLLDTATTPSAVTQTLDTSSKPGAASQYEEDTISLTSTGYAAGKLIHLAFSRLGGHANDTKAASITLWDLSFQYSDA